jgi:hypothetical protein
VDSLYVKDTTDENGASGGLFRDISARRVYQTRTDTIVSADTAVYRYRNISGCIQANGSNPDGSGCIREEGYSWISLDHDRTLSDKIVVDSLPDVRDTSNTTRFVRHQTTSIRDPGRVVPQQNYYNLRKTQQR